MCLALLINSGNTALNILKVWSHLTCLLFPSVCIYRVSFVEQKSLHLYDAMPILHILDSIFKKVLMFNYKL